MFTRGFGKYLNISERSDKIFLRGRFLFPKMKTRLKLFLVNHRENALKSIVRWLSVFEFQLQFFLKPIYFCFAIILNLARVGYRFKIFL